MAFVSKEWKTRKVEYPGRRVLKNPTTGVSTTYDVSRAEGEILQEGDAFSSANMNDLEQRVSNEFGKINKNLGGLSFGKDGDGNYGYYGDDDVLVPFKAGAVLLYEIVYSESTPLNTTYEIDCTSLPNYKKLTADNFFAGMTLGFAGHLSGTEIAWGSSALDISSYDAGTGILYVAARTWTNTGSGNSYRMNGKVFYIG